MTDPLARIERKLEQLDAKLDRHLERIAKVETSTHYLKWGLSLLITITSTAAMAFAKLVN